MTVHSQKWDKDPFSFEKDMKDMFSKDNINKRLFNNNSNVFSNSSDYFGDAKKLYAEGERMFRNGQFQQGQKLFQEAEQQLRQAKSKLPFQPFDSRKADFNSPTDSISNKKTWKASTLAVLGVGTLALLVAGKQLIATHSAQLTLNVPFSPSFGLATEPDSLEAQHCITTSIASTSVAAKDFTCEMQQ